MFMDLLNQIIMQSNMIVGVDSLQHGRFLLYALIVIASIIIAVRFISHMDGAARKVLIFDNLAIALFLSVGIIRGVLDILDCESYGNWVIVVAAAILLITRTILALFVSSFDIRKNDR